MNKKNILPFVQAISGFPSYPNVHEHNGLWLMTLQTALDPHAQGSRHTALMQDRSVEQSSSLVHSILRIGLVAWQVPLPLLTYPLGHTHTMVRIGYVGRTRHSDGSVHGCMTEHGFWHLLLRQASLSGQSLSSLHSGLTSGWQLTYGLPVKRGGQRHIGKWFRTLHSAWDEHGLSCTQGSIHCMLMQEWSPGQSPLL